EVLLGELRASDQRRDLLLLDHLPIDERFDIGMIDVDRHHLGGSPGRAAGFNRAGSAIADLEEAHETGGAAAARELFVLAAELREIGAGAGAVFENTRFAHPEIDDAAV